MTGRADLRATAERIRRDYGHLFGHTEREAPAPRLSPDRLEEARRRVSGRRRERAQLELDLRQR